LLAEDRFHIAGGDEEGSGAAVPGDGDWLALGEIEQLAEFVLGLG
jgi:hypothetical protein